jgi:hypothetical protein
MRTNHEPLKLAEAARAAIGTTAHPMKLRSLWRCVIARRLEAADLSHPTKDPATNRAIARAALLRDELGRARATRNTGLALALGPLHAIAMVPIRSTGGLRTLAEKAADDATRTAQIVAGLRSILAGKTSDPKAVLSEIREVAKALLMPPEAPQPGEAADTTTIDSMFAAAIGAIGTSDLALYLEDLLALFTEAGLNVIDQPPPPAASAAKAPPVRTATATATDKRSGRAQYRDAVNGLRLALDSHPALEPSARRGLAQARAAARAEFFEAEHKRSGMRDSMWALRARQTLAAAATAPASEGMLPEEEIADLLKRIARGDADPTSLVLELETMLAATPADAFPDGKAPDVSGLVAEMRAAAGAGDDEALLAAVQACAEAFGIKLDDVPAKGPAPRSAKMARARLALGMRRANAHEIRAAKTTLALLGATPR